MEANDKDERVKDSAAIPKEAENTASADWLPRNLIGRKLKRNAREDTKKICITAIFIALIAVAAFIRIPSPLVPFTLQIFAVCMAMLMLGPWWGGAAVLIYIIMGLIGIPVFTSGGGIGSVLSPTFGYIIGFLAGTVCGGLVLSRVKRKRIAVPLAIVVFEIIVYFFGLLHFYLVKSLYLSESVTAATVFISCFLIFLPTDILQCALGVIIAGRLKRFRLYR